MYTKYFLLIFMLTSTISLQAQVSRFIMGGDITSYHTMTKQNITNYVGKESLINVDNINADSNTTDLTINIGVFLGLQLWEQLDIYTRIGYVNQSVFYLLDKNKKHTIYGQKESMDIGLQIRYNLQFNTLFALYINGGFGSLINFASYFRYTTDTSNNIFTMAFKKSTNLEQNQEFILAPYIPFGAGFSFRFGTSSYSRISLGYTGKFFLSTQEHTFLLSDTNTSKKLTIKTPQLTHGITLEYAHIF